jgi:hypothetical protein
MLPRLGPKPKNFGPRCGHSRLGADHLGVELAHGYVLGLAASLPGADPHWPKRPMGKCVF